MSQFDLFVYGTLRTGGSANERLVACVKVADATIPGTLYDIDGRFPVMICYGSDRIAGEIWRCPAELLPSLDEYEGTATGLLRRIGAEAETAEGALVPCWVYVAGPTLAHELTPERRTSVWPRPSARRPHMRGLRI